MPARRAFHPPGSSQRTKMPARRAFPPSRLEAERTQNATRRAFGLLVRASTPPKCPLDGHFTLLATASARRCPARRARRAYSSLSLKPAHKNARPTLPSGHLDALPRTHATHAEHGRASAPLASELEERLVFRFGRRWRGRGRRGRLVGCGRRCDASGRRRPRGSRLDLRRSCRRTSSEPPPTELSSKPPPTELSRTAPTESTERPLTGCAGALGAAALASGPARNHVRA